MRYVKCPGEWGGESKKCSTQLRLKRTEKTYQRGTITGITTTSITIITTSITIIDFVLATSSW